MDYARPARSETLRQLRLQPDGCIFGRASEGPARRRREYGHAPSYRYHRRAIPEQRIGPSNGVHQAHGDQQSAANTISPDRDAVQRAYSLIRTAIEPACEHASKEQRDRPSQYHPNGRTGPETFRYRVGVVGSRALKPRAIPAIYIRAAIPAATTEPPIMAPHLIVACPCASTRDVIVVSVCSMISP